MYDHLVVGAGLSGTTFARAALDAGRSVLVIDRRDHVAGNCHTAEVAGIVVHKHGPHIFHTNSERIWRFVGRFATFNHFRLHGAAMQGGRLYSMPPGLRLFSQLWGVSTPDEARARVEADRVPCSHPTNFEEFALDAVGREVYERFYRGYTAKQWGRDPRELPTSIARRLPIRYTWDDRWFADRFEGIPEGGYTPMVARMLDGADVEAGVDYLDDRGRWDRMARSVVYTGAIDEFFGHRHGALPYRSLRFEERVLDEEDHQGAAIVSYPDESTPWTRQVEHRHFAPGVAPSGRTVITREYPEAWSAGKPAYYPIEDEAGRRLHGRYRADWDALGPKYVGTGRLFDYRYYNMDQAIGAALTLARRVVRVAADGVLVSAV